MNAFGADVGGLDVPAFLERARLVAALGLALWALLLVRLRRPAVLVAGAVAANAFVWFVTCWPLQRLYALGPSADRLTNLGWCTVVAAAGAPLQTTQVGQLHFEPFWGVLVAALAGFDPERVLTLYPFLSLALARRCCRSCSTSGCGRRRPATGGRRGNAPRRPRPRASCGRRRSTSSAPTATAWSLSLLLKPNHSLAILMFPVFLYAFVRIRGTWGRIAVGLFLHVLAWAFVLHMAYIAVGLAVYAVLELLARRADARARVLDVAVVFGVNLLIVSPYLVMLLVGYPFLTPLPRNQIASISPHLLEPTVRLGLVFPLGVWGAVVAYRRGDRLGRAWTAQLVGIYVVWLGYLVLSAMHQARERDEVHHWLRLLIAVSAGIGAWDLAGRAARCWRARGVEPALRAAALLVLAAPWSLPYWWDPARMDPYFPRSLPPIERTLAEPAEFIRRHAAPRDVVASDPDYSRWIAALGARRVLRDGHTHRNADHADREAVLETLLRGTDAAEVRGRRRALPRALPGGDARAARPRIRASRWRRWPRASTGSRCSTRRKARNGRSSCSVDRGAGTCRDDRSSGRALRAAARRARSRRARRALPLRPLCARASAGPWWCGAPAGPGGPSRERRSCSPHSASGSRRSAARTACSRTGPRRCGPRRSR